MGSLQILPCSCVFTLVTLCYTAVLHGCVAMCKNVIELIGIWASYALAMIAALVNFSL